MLREQPDLLSALVEKLTGRALQPGLVPVDSTVRFVAPAEVRPDLLLADEKDWAMVEVQDQIDPDKQRRWLLAASLLFDQKQTLGDVIVITARKSVARWASTAAQAETARGTRLALWPVVLYVGRDEIDALLSEKTPALAVIAAWAVSHRHGFAALRVVERAIEVTNALPLALQTAQRNAILGLARRAARSLAPGDEHGPRQDPDVPFRTPAHRPPRRARGPGSDQRARPGAPDDDLGTRARADQGGAGGHRRLPGSGRVQSLDRPGDDRSLGERESLEPTWRRRLPDRGRAPRRPPRRRPGPSGG